jgi:hypothetical protein
MISELWKRSRECILIIIGRNGVDNLFQTVCSFLPGDLHKFYVVFFQKNSLSIKYSGVESSESIILCELPDTQSVIGRKHSFLLQQKRFFSKFPDRQAINRTFLAIKSRNY